MTQVQIKENIIFNTYCNEINSNTFNLETIDNEFAISKTKNGKILSRYEDLIWDFSPYAPINTTNKINFEKKFNNDSIIIEEAKKLVFIALVFGKGKRASLISVNSLLNLFNRFIVPILYFSKEHNHSIKEIFENEHLLLKYSLHPSRAICHTGDFCTFLKILSKTNNAFTNIQYKLNKKFLKELNFKGKQHTSQYKQTSIIPSRILNNATKQRWQHVSNVEKHIDNIELFLMYCLKDKSFGISNSSKNKIKIRNRTIIFWNEAVIKYQLDNFFRIYSIKNKKSLFKFIHSFKITCKHLILTYTGMREGELYSLKNNCFITENNSSIIVGISTKLEIASKEVKWITSKDIERVVVILNKLNTVTADSYDLDYNSLQLFCSNIMYPNFVNRIKYHDYKNVIYDAKELYFDTKEIQITQKDIDEIEDINFNRSSHEIKVGNIWNFTTHQYRRSLAVYTIQSGIVSLGALQIQLKHLFKEMTLYYSNGASYARKLFDVSSNHIANDINNLKPELDTLAYIKNVIFSDEKSFGIHGSFVEKNTKKIKKDFKKYFFENREKTLKQFKNGEMAYKETALGSCVSTEACDSRLIRSITSCFDCHGGVLKKSKVDNVIQKQKEFISFLDKNSIEYKTEIDELHKLENLRNKLIKE